MSVPKNISNFCIARCRRKALISSSSSLYSHMIETHVNEIPFGKFLSPRAHKAMLGPKVCKNFWLTNRNIPIISLLLNINAFPGTKLTFSHTKARNIVCRLARSVYVCRNQQRMLADSYPILLLRLN